MNGSWLRLQNAARAAMLSSHRRTVSSHRLMIHALNRHAGHLIVSGVRRVSTRHVPTSITKHAADASATPNAVEPGASTSEQPSKLSPLALGRVYMELSKSKLSALVILTTAAGHAMAQAPLDPTTVASLLGGTFLCAASANSFNQVHHTFNLIQSSQMLTNI
eukprot:384976-Pleurochrysis_carterae.AAC.1